LKRDYQVIVVGAGPAGSTLAYELAKKGIEVAVLEKQTLPRYKCCAGGVSAGAARLLGADIQGLAEDTITEATIGFRSNRPFRGRYNEPLMYTVMRDKFDYALARRAKEAGAVVLEGHEVKRIAVCPRWVEVSTSGGHFRAQYLAGADGAQSQVARELSLRTNSEHIVAMQSEVQVRKEELTKLRSQIVMDLGCVPGGYAWVFPKVDHLSIGMACLSSKAKGLKQRYRDFLTSLNVGGVAIRRGAALLPVLSRDPAVYRGRVALVGDAAGLVDPLTGEGIYNAVWSAQLAAGAIAEAVAQNSPDLQGYQRAVDHHIAPELRVARALSRVFVRFPSLVFGMLVRDERVWRGCCLLLRREISYAAIMQRLGGPRGLRTLLFGK
jgi:geranylgeranyl reductase family protein